MRYILLSYLVLLAIPQLSAEQPSLFLAPTVPPRVDAEELIVSRRFTRAEPLMLNVERLVAVTEKADFELSFLGIKPTVCSMAPLQPVSESSRGWHGTFDGGSITLILRPIEVKDGTQLPQAFVAAGTIQAGAALYQIRQAAEGLVLVREVDYGSLPNELEPIVPDVEMNATAAPDAVSAPQQFTVAVFYTSKALAGEGGTSQMESLIDLAITETNTAYANSGVNARLALVHKSITTDAESGGFKGMLEAMQNPSDGRMDEVHAARNTHKADLVILICDDSTSCGLAYQMSTRSSSFERWAFSVVNRDCATGYYSFAHELGHNMGCCHDAAHPEANPIYPYAYGWHFEVGLSGEQVRTIMAYAPGKRIQYFSNPDVSIGIYPTGKAGEANNALTINNTASTVAAFR